MEKNATTVKDVKDENTTRTQSKLYILKQFTLNVQRVKEAKMLSKESEDQLTKIANEAMTSYLNN